MDQTLKYILAGAGIATISTMAFKLLSDSTSQSIGLIFISASLFALLGMLIVNLYIGTRKLDTTRVIHNNIN